MKKIAIFCEGMTEQIFVVTLIGHILSGRAVEFELTEQFRGLVAISTSAPPVGTEFYILIVDCHSDGQVKTQINDRYHGLINAGYTAIIGIRDVFPMTLAELPALRQNLMTGVVTGAVPVELHLAILEMEAWFLSDLAHFPQISSKLSVAAIQASGFNLSRNPSSWAHPAATLHSIYQLASAAYMSGGKRKSKKRIRRTIDALDMGHFCGKARQICPDLDGLVNSIEAAIA